MTTPLSDVMRLPGSALLTGPGTWRDGSSALLLHAPDRILQTSTPADVPAVLDEVAAAMDRGAVVVGLLAYEAAQAFGLTTHAHPSSVPLAWFAVYRADVATEVSRSQLLPPPGPAAAAGDAFELNVSPEEHREAVTRIRAHIAAGDTYQVNFTCQGRFRADIDPWTYFLALTRAHPVPYAAFVNLGDTQILSLSPELFLRRRGATVESRPMKGTRPRGRTLEEDDAMARALVASNKDRAENIMILDMMRNDLSRFCEIGSVVAPEVCVAERYRSVWQMTSRVAGTAPADVSLRRIFEDTFPASSITGAPKRRTMEIIREMEREPRGVYTGTIGLFGPGSDFTCSVAIRTLVHRGGDFTLGLGAGIVWDSDASAEYQETLLKSRFAFAPQTGIRLFETLRLDTDRRYAFTAEHVERLERSARYWDIPCDAAAVTRALGAFAAAATGLPLRVHVECDADGRIDISSTPLPDPAGRPLRVLLAREPVDSRDARLFHKTTARDLYTRTLADAQALGFDEVIFTNERGHVTEGSYTNLFAKVNGRWITPPVTDGLLPGIWRQHYLRTFEAREASLTPGDLARAEAILLGNSVRGAMQVGEVCAQGPTLDPVR